MKNLIRLAAGFGGNRTGSGVFVVATNYSSVSTNKITRKSKKSADR
jgi:hypothetical protein